jgi:hypothetical protein
MHSLMPVPWRLLEAKDSKRVRTARKRKPIFYQKGVRTYGLSRGGKRTDGQWTDRGGLQAHIPLAGGWGHLTNLIPNILPRRHITSHTVFIAELGMRFRTKRVGRSVAQSSTILAPVSDTSTSWHSRSMKEPSTVIHAETEFRRRRTSRLSILDIA